MGRLGAGESLYRSGVQTVALGVAGTVKVITCLAAVVVQTEAGAPAQIYVNGRDDSSRGTGAIATSRQAEQACAC